MNGTSDLPCFCFFYEELFYWLQVLELTAYASLSPLFVITPSEHEYNADNIKIVQRETMLRIMLNCDSE